MTNYADTNGQPAPAANSGASVHDLVIDDMKHRKAFGLAKYSSLLQAHNGRDALMDLYQELLDATCYARQLLEERDNPPAARMPVPALADHENDVCMDCGYERRVHHEYSHTFKTHRSLRINQ
jgi:hypothetical protein